MTLQLIVSEIADIPHMFEPVRIMFEQVNSVPEVVTEQDIDILFSAIIKLGVGGIVYPNNVNVGMISNHARVSRRYIDSNSILDDFV